MEGSQHKNILLYYFYLFQQHIQVLYIILAQLCKYEQNTTASKITMLNLFRYTMTCHNWPMQKQGDSTPHKKIRKKKTIWARQKIFFVLFSFCWALQEYVIFIFILWLVFFYQNPYRYYSEVIYRFSVINSAAIVMCGRGSWWIYLFK